MHRARYRSLASMLAGASLAHVAVAAAQAPRADPPVVVEARAVADMIGVAGGDAHGVRLLRDLEVAADADLGALVGWTGARARVHLLSGGGRAAERPGRHRAGHRQYRAESGRDQALRSLD
ncbi:hypothetical protein [Sphingomonas ginsenosidivorax]|uniref:hypothetical protein n=1 Tax=Sphingomonas ginsenosidivorax TaxID=862135 RepID=UPI001F5555DA|nr:hypothetical protein [Sphingomonas ginsenosidivorax]